MADANAITYISDAGINKLTEAFNNKESNIRLSHVILSSRDISEFADNRKLQQSKLLKLKEGEVDLIKYIHKTSENNRDFVVDVYLLDKEEKESKNEIGTIRIDIRLGASVGTFTIGQIGLFLGRNSVVKKTSGRYNPEIVISLNNPLSKSKSSFENIGNKVTFSLNVNFNYENGNYKVKLDNDIVIKHDMTLPGDYNDPVEQIAKSTKISIAKSQTDKDESPGTHEAKYTKPYIILNKIYPVKDNKVSGSYSGRLGEIVNKPKGSVVARSSDIYEREIGGYRIRGTNLKFQIWKLHKDDTFLGIVDDHQTIASYGKIFTRYPHTQNILLFSNHWSGRRDTSIKLKVNEFTPGFIKLSHYLPTYYNRRTNPPPLGNIESVLFLGDYNISEAPELMKAPDDRYYDDFPILHEPVAYALDKNNALILDPKEKGDDLKRMKSIERAKELTSTVISKAATKIKNEFKSDATGANKEFVESEVTKKFDNKEKTLSIVSHNKVVANVPYNTGWSGWSWNSSRALRRMRIRTVLIEEKNTGLTYNSVECLDGWFDYDGFVPFQVRFKEIFHSKSVGQKSNYIWGIAGLQPASQLQGIRQGFRVRHKPSGGAWLSGMKIEVFGIRDENYDYQF